MQMSEELNPGLSKSESSETEITKQLAKAQKEALKLARVDTNQTGFR